MKRVKKNNEVEIKNRLPKKNKKIPYSKLEFIFNLVSLLFAISIGIYFGGRSFYYYSDQASTLAKAVYTLNGSITTNNQVVTDGDGLHQDVDGYYFKGDNLNNYVYFANRLFRVIRVNNDGSTKLISENIATEFMWGEDENYVSSNLDNWLDRKEDKNGTGVYYDTIPFISDFLVKTKYNIPTFSGNSVENGKDELQSYVTTLSIKDYSLANGKNSYLNNGKYFWLIGLDDNGKNLYVSEDGSLLSGEVYEAYGIRPVITLKSNIPISQGNGSKDNPYVINQGGKTNLVHSDIKIGNDTWKVFYDKEDVIKMAYTNYLTGDRPYNSSGGLYDVTKTKSLPYYFNYNFYNSLTYKDYLLDLLMFTGEVSSDTSLDYINIYSSNVKVKVGMLNLFDYQVLGGDNYYLANTTSSVGDMVYVYHNNGLLEEADANDIKQSIPVISISKKMIDTTNNNGFFVR